MTPPPPDLVSTREALRALACYVIAPKRKALTGRIGLRPTGDGIGTPWFDDGTRVAVRGNRLLLEPRADLELTTLRAAAAFLDVVLSADPGVGHDLPPFSPDDELTVDADASRWLGSWYDFGGQQLDRLRAELAAGAVSEAQLWPEHFDLAAVVTVGDDAVNVGFSPGDATDPEPYLYVGPHDRSGLDDGYWNASFGAVLRHTELRAAPDPAERAHDFVQNGLHRVAARPATGTDRDVN